MGDRFATRSLAVAHALASRIASPGRARAPEHPRRILVAHSLLLGDTLMLTPLVAKLRALHREAEIALLAHPAFVPLYAGRPYGARALPFSPRDSATARSLLDEAAFDVAIVPGDNRHSWIAAAMRSRHIVAHAGDRPWTKNVFIDDARAYGAAPAAWGDLVADLVDGSEPPAFRAPDWPAPAAAAFDPPPKPYAVLHVGASTPLKQWHPERWNALAERLSARGLTVAWSAGRGEEAIVAACDPKKRHASFAGRLDLAQLWHLLKGAQLLVAPDTGVAHLGRVTFTPTVTLFGPGSAVICGPGRFWRDAPWRAATVEAFPCRDQKILFRREIEWVRRCGRSTAECAEPRCMQAIEVDAVERAIDSLPGAAR